MTITNKYMTIIKEEKTLDEDIVIQLEHSLKNKEILVPLKSALNMSRKRATSNKRKYL